MAGRWGEEKGMIIRKRNSLASNNHCWKSQFKQRKEKGTEPGTGWAGAQGDRLQRNKI